MACLRQAEYFCLQKYLLLKGLIMKQPTAYLPLEKFHIIPINGLSPDEIKASVSDVSRHR